MKCMQEFPYVFVRRGRRHGYRLHDTQLVEPPIDPPSLSMTQLRAQLVEPPLDPPSLSMTQLRVPLAQQPCVPLVEPPVDPPSL